MNYKIGLDIGITSVGWATVELDNNDEPIRIINLGSRIFDVAENPKDGSSLAKPRREARSARRRLRRHRHRLERIRNLIIASGLLTENELQCIFDGQLEDIYKLRVKALDQLITKKEFARLLIHFAQRRGFQSNRKSDSADKEAGKLLSAIKQNQTILEEKQYRTVGEMLYKDDAFKEHKRNKGGDYSHTVSRSMVAQEINLIFEQQKKFGFPLLDGFGDQYLNILLSQRSFDQGPGAPSPYAGNQVEKMIGKCTFEPEENRAVKASYSFEYFSLLQNINHMRILCAGSTRSLTDEERKKLIRLAHTSPNLNYSKLRKELALSPAETFVGLSYGDKSIDEVEKKTKFSCLKAYHEIRKAIDKVKKHGIQLLSRKQLNAIGYAFTVFKNDEQISDTLKQANIDDVFISALLMIPGFSKVGHLSIKACNKIIPFLEQGMKYNEACEAADYEFKAHSHTERSKLLPAVVDEFEDITNPVVRRAVSQTIKVVNAIIRDMKCSPIFLSIELARELSKNFDERKKIEKSQEDNQARNDRVMERIQNEFGKYNATGMDIVKLKLWEEQDGICPYSLQPLDVQKIFDIGYVDIDHIIPYSISFNDSYRNKVLVKTQENRQKGNRLPMQYLTGERREKFQVWVNNTIRDYRKRQILLKEKLSDEDLKGFKERNLQDTKYISKLLRNFINDYLEFAPSQTGKKKHVTAVNGSVTSYMRKRWGISKIRENGDLHHAVDALVIACVTDGMIQKVSRYANYHEMEYVQDETGSVAVNPKTGEVFDRFPLPWPLFRKELDIRLSNQPAEYLKNLNFYRYPDAEIGEIKTPFVSRMPKHKVKGAAHKETIRSPKLLDTGYSLSKKPLTTLKLNKDGEIEGYYNPQSDTLLYNALKQRLMEYGGKGTKAFEEPFYKPMHNGMPGHLVKKVKIMEKSTLNVTVHEGKGAADHDSMVRIDVFYIENDGYYMVPIYVADTLKNTLPNKAIVAFKSYSEWKEMDDQNFLYSLYPNDLIKVTAKKPIKLSLLYKDSTLPQQLEVNNCFLYYNSAKISGATIQVFNHDHSYIVQSMGIKTLKLLEKYQVDVLGNISKVKKETRRYFK